MTHSWSTLPEAPESRPLGWDDRTWLETLLADARLGTSEMTFTNLITWSQTHPAHLARVGESVLLWRGPAERGMLLPPLGPPLERDQIHAALAWAAAVGGPARFARVPESVARQLVEAEPALVSAEDRDHADYVYHREDLAMLAGRKYDGKRNLLKKFEKAVQAEFQAIDNDLARRCLELQRHWCLERGCSEHPDLDAEDRAVMVALERWDALPLVGGALVTDEGRIAAFSVAEALTDDTAVVHFEKGSTLYPGVYQAINRFMAERQLDGFAFVNREQDLGLPGLRKAKLSYHPAHLVGKFTLHIG